MFYSCCKAKSKHKHQTEQFNAKLIYGFALNGDKIMWKRLTVVRKSQVQMSRSTDFRILW